MALTSSSGNPLQKEVNGKHDVVPANTRSEGKSEDLAMKLTVSRNFFSEFAQRQWKNSLDLIRELVENSYDADASKVIVTFLGDGLAIEDDGGMDEEKLRSFMEVGGMHDAIEYTPSGRKKVGKYKVGRLSALGVFKKMRVRTKLDDFHTAFSITDEDLLALSSGSAEIPSLDLPPIQRERGTEILLTGAKVALNYEEAQKMLSQMPILRTPGFELYLKKAETFVEWDLGSASRILPREIRGIKIPVKLPDIEGVITIADDSALPLAPEDRGIGVVVSSHLVTRTYFGFEGTPYRFDRVTGYVECDRLRTTYGTKSEIIEDDEYSRFCDAMRKFIQEVVIPRLSEIEVRRMNVAELRVLKKVNRALGKAIVGVLAGSTVQGQVDTSVLKELVQRQVITRTAQGSRPAEPQAERAETVGSSEIEEQPIKREQRVQRKTQGRGSLLDLGIIMLFYDDENDSRPSYSNPHFNVQGTEVKTVFINRKHPSYLKAMKGHLIEHIIYLVSNEIVGMNFEESQIAEIANRLYASTMAYA